MQPLLEWKIRKQLTTYFECVCSLRYPTCNGHAPCCPLWPVRLYIVFPHYHIRGRIFKKEKKKLDVKCALIFATNLSETFLILRTFGEILA
jgi:hypothetical protein